MLRKRLNKATYHNMQDGEVIEVIKDFRVTDLRLDAKYQCVINKSQVKRLTEDMGINGFDLACPIVVNQHNQVIVGTHRTHAARAAGLKTVPVIRKYYRTVEKEAEYHTHSNTTSRKMGPQEIIWDYYCANRPFAVTLYTLYHDPTAALHRNIELANTDLPHNTKRCHTASRTIFIINLAAFSTNLCWKDANVDSFDAFVEEYGYGWIKAKTDEFFSIYYEAYDNKLINKAAWNDRVIRGLGGFYYQLRGGEPGKGDRLAKISNPNEIDPRKRTSLVNSLKRFPFSAEDLSGDHALMIAKFATHYNKRRKGDEVVTYVVGG